MPVTATPIFAQTPNVGALNVRLSTAMANTGAFDGTQAVGTALALVYTAGVNGSRVDQVTCRLASTNGVTASGTSAATVVRFWLNNGSANTTAANNIFIGEVAIPATAVTALGTSSLQTYPLPIPLGGLSIPPGYRVYAGLTVAAGGTGIAISIDTQGGDY